MVDKFPYLVVRFVSESSNFDSSVSEVPSNWIVDENFCYWPKKSKFSMQYLLQHRSLPDVKTWTKHEIVIEAECANLESARKKAVELMSSDDEECRGRGKRNIVRPQKYRSSSDDDSSSSYSHASEGSWRRLTNIPPPPLLKEFTASNAINSCSGSEQSLHKTNDVDPVSEEDLNARVDSVASLPIIFENIPIQGGIMVEQPQIWDNNIIVENTNIRDQQVLQNIERLLADLKVQNSSIEQRLQRIENILSEGTDLRNSAQENNIFETLLPVNSLEDLNKFEALLSNNTDMVKKILKRIGAKTPKENAQRLGSKVFTNSLLVNCSWKGRSENFKLCNLFVMQIIKGVVMDSFHFYQDIAFEYDMAEWVRFAKQRMKREK